MIASLQDFFCFNAFCSASIIRSEERRQSSINSWYGRCWQCQCQCQCQFNVRVFTLTDTADNRNANTCCCHSSSSSSSSSDWWPCSGRGGIPRDTTTVSATNGGCFDCTTAT